MAYHIISYHIISHLPQITTVLCTTTSKLCILRSRFPMSQPPPSPGPPGEDRRGSLIAMSPRPQTQCLRVPDLDLDLHCSFGMCLRTYVLQSTEYNCPVADPRAVVSNCIVLRRTAGLKNDNDHGVLTKISGMEMARDGGYALAGVWFFTK